MKSAGGVQVGTTKSTSRSFDLAHAPQRSKRESLRKSAKNVVDGRFTSMLMCVWPADGMNESSSFRRLLGNESNNK